MHLENYNMDLSKKISIPFDKTKWIQSPASQIYRLPYEREKAESGRTTSLVEYLPNAQFNEHSHPLGEEIFVLEGIFSDETGDYPAGSYLRNPPGSKHSPFSKEGCLIFVKLNQFESDDLDFVRIKTRETAWLQGQGKLEVMPLHQHKTSSTALVKWPAGEKFLPHRHFGGEEIFVISGEFKDEHGSYPKHTWLRSPHLSAHHPWVDEETIILVKTGHLV